MKNNSINIIGKSSYLWFIGWLSLGLVEVGFRLTLSPPPMTLMIFFTLLVYSLVGVVLGSLFGIIFLLIQRIGRGLKRPDNLTHFSLAACISIILFLYALLFFLKGGASGSSSHVVFKSVVFLSLSILPLFIFSFFLRWMDRQGRAFISYLALLPALWIVSSLALNVNRKILPPVLQVSTISRVFLLILGSVLCFFFFYFLCSAGRRFLSRWKDSLFLKPGLIILPLALLLLFLFFLLSKEDHDGRKKGAGSVPEGKPNILLITLDTVRADHVSCYGYERQTTPNLDAFSREGVLYKNAYATSSWTLPSHASIFTGKYPTRHGAHFNTNSAQIAKYFESQKGQQFDMSDLNTKSILKLSEDNITLAEILSERGYRTAGIIGGPFTASIFGLAQGFDYYDEKFLDVEKDTSFSLICQLVDLFFSLKDFIAQHGYSAVKRSASQLNEAAFQWLEKNHEQPFFLFINYFDAHTPYLPPPPYDGYFGKTDKGIIAHYSPRTGSSYVTAESVLMFAVIAGSHQLTPEEKELFVTRYDGEIRYLDHCLGLLLERLKSLKIYDNTLIIITSDHGEAFGEHSLVSHGRTLYEEMLRVPLIIKYPSASPGRGVIEKRVSLVDLFSTILFSLGYPIPSGIDGGILVKSDHPIIAEWYYKWWDPEKYQRDLKSVYQGKYKYIWASSGLNELYDLEKDPGEENNLIQKFPHGAQEMQGTLNQWLTSFKPPGAEGKAVKINKSMEEKLRALGYVK